MGIRVKLIDWIIIRRLVDDLLVGRGGWREGREGWEEERLGAPGAGGATAIPQVGLMKGS